MDGTTNPGPRIDFGPTSPGWVGTTACNNTPYQYPLTAVPADTIVHGAVSTTVCNCCKPWASFGMPEAEWRSPSLTASIIGEPSLPGYAPCGCYVGPWWSITPPPRCPVHAESAVPFAPMMPTTTTTTLTFTPVAPPLSDSDVERIARRVVELMREAKP